MSSTSSASDLLLHTIQICSLLFSSSWSSMLVVINKITEVWLCSNLQVGQSQLLFALRQSSINSQLFIKNRDFWPLHLHLMPPLGGLHQNIAIRFGMQKLEWFGYLTVKKCGGYDYSFWQNHKCDRRMDTTWLHRPHLCITLHVKNHFTVACEYAYMIYSLGWQILVAAPPTVIHGLSMVWPPFTVVPASSAPSWSTSNYFMTTELTDYEYYNQGRINHSPPPPQPPAKFFLSHNVL